MADGIEFDHGNGEAVFSAVIKDGALELDIGEDWAGRHQGPHRPQGFQRFLDFSMTPQETRQFLDWLRAKIEPECVAEGMRGE